MGQLARQVPIIACASFKLSRCRTDTATSEQVGIDAIPERKPLRFFPDLFGLCYCMHTRSYSLCKWRDRAPRRSLPSSSITVEGAVCYALLNERSQYKKK